MQQDKKQYGLIKLTKNSGKASASLANKPSIFGDLDEDFEEGTDSDSASVPQFQSKNVRKQAQVNISKAIEENPDIFQYDEVYDEMKNASESKQKQNTKNVEKKSRYISNMLKHRDTREKEQEIRSERQIQKEREMEGDEFQDKEAFVTSAYKNKLEQLKKVQEDLEKQDKIENILDVTKQNNLDGFYRSVFRNNLFNNETTSEQNENIQSTQTVKFNKKSSNQKKGNLRERNLTDDENEDENNSENNVIAESATSEHSVKVLHLEEATIATTPNVEETQKIPTPTRIEPDSKDVIETTTKTAEDVSNDDKENESEVLPVKKPKIDRAELIRRMFAKRTVGVAFDEARNRYLERKAQRQMHV